MKTLEEIKNGLKTCAHDLNCNQCTYKGFKCLGLLMQDAVEALQQLEAKVPKWFSAEHTPPTATRKSVDGHDISDLVLSYCNGIYTPAYFNHKEQVWYDETDEWLFVTDWMPLPVPPEV